jgi:hypothetical protein
MTTPVKTYQNVSFQELIAFSEHNPHRSTTLKRQEVKQTDERILHKLDLPDYISSVIEPAGILGICTCITDPNYYYMALPNVRKQMLIDLATKLQEKSDELKTSSIARKRKKIYDLIGAAFNMSAITDKDYMDLFQGISVLCQLQFILVKETVQEGIEEGTTPSMPVVINESGVKGDILFATNPIHWTKEQPIWIVDYRGRWIATPHTVTVDHIYGFIAEWICDIQQNGWIVQWPEIDATKVELVAQLSGYPSWQESDRKLSKDQLSVRLGRLQTIQTFSSW